MAGVAITKDNFAEKTASGLVLVDFQADWCGPCQMMKPVLEEVIEEGREGLTIGAVDIDAEGELASEKGVMSVPTFHIYKDGELVDSWSGAVTKSELVERLDKHA